MTSDSCPVETALARNLLSSLLALAFPCDVDNENDALEAFVMQQPALRKALEHHNVFGLVTDGKALIKWQTRLLQIIDGTSAACRIGWELLLIMTRQSPLARLEVLAVKVLERVMKRLKQQQSITTEDVDADKATAASCGVAQALLRHIDRYNSDTRREVLELLGKLLQPLVTLLSSKRHSSNPIVLIAQFELIKTLLCASPNSLRGYVVKIESACVGTLFPVADMSDDDEIIAEKAMVCLALLCNASDKPQQVWTQMAQKALEAAHQQLDLFAGKRSTVPSIDGIAEMGKKFWVQGTASHQLPVYQRAEVTVTRMTRALNALNELLTVCTATQSRGRISEREAQQILPDVVSFARRAIGVRAHEVGKHTGVSDDGMRLPISVIYAVTPRVHAQTLRLLSALVQRTGICALRHTNNITRVLLLASESVGDGEDLLALADAAAVCARCLGASTVEMLGVPLLNELATRCKRSLGEETSGTIISNNTAKTSATQQDDAKNSGSKSKKRKRQAAAAATLAALNVGKTSAGQAGFVSMHNETVIALTLEAGLSAIASLVSVYGSLLPENCRSLVSELTLKAVQRRHAVGPCHAHSAVDPVALALLSNTVTADATGSNGANLLSSMQYWQHHITGCGGASSALQLVALNAGEAILHPRAPPLTINFQLNTHNVPENNGCFGANSKQRLTTRGDIIDWDKTELDESADENENEDKHETNILKMAEAPTVSEEEDKEDYDDARPQAAIMMAPMEVVALIAVEEAEGSDDDDDMVEEEPAANGGNSAKGDDDKIVPVATAVDDDDDDDFPDIVIDDDD